MTGGHQPKTWVENRESHFAIFEVKGVRAMKCHRNDCEQIAVDLHGIGMVTHGYCEEHRTCRGCGLCQDRCDCHVAKQYPTFKRPFSWVWFWQWGVTVVFAWKLFQIQRVKDELYSQRHDPWRIRLCGLSIKLFG